MKNSFLGLSTSASRSVPIIAILFVAIGGLQGCKKTVLKDKGSSASLVGTNNGGNDDSGGVGNSGGVDPNSVTGVECSILNTYTGPTNSPTEVIYYQCLRRTVGGSLLSGGVTDYECQVDGGAFVACNSTYAHALVGLTNGPHTFVVRAKHGNFTGTSAPLNWTVNVGSIPGPSPSPAGPVTVSCTILTSFSGTRTNTSEIINYYCLRNQDGNSSSTGLGNYECILDGGTAVSCSSTQFVTPALSNGAHTFKVRATASGVTGESAVMNWTTNVSASSPSPSPSVSPSPSTQTIACSVLSGPYSGWSSNSNASFQFLCSKYDNGAPVAATLTYSCVRNGTVAPCQSPTAHSYSGLSDGTHTFYVRATEGALEGTSPLSIWSVDRTKPVMTYAAATNGTNNPPRFDFEGDDGGGSGLKKYLCKFNAVYTSWSDCSNVYPTGRQNKEFSALPVNTNYVFSVKVVDQANNESDARDVSFRIDPPRPSGRCVITNGITSPSRLRTQAMTFTCPADAVTVKCRLNGGTPVTCNSPTAHTLTGLPEGPNTFYVYYVDQYGQDSDPSDPKNWDVDTTAPQVRITNAQTSTLTPSFAFVGEDPGRPGAHLVYECKLVHSSGVIIQDWGSCGSPKNYTTGVIPGQRYSFYVKVTDEAGNEGQATEGNWLSNPGTGPSCQILTQFNPLWRRNTSENINFNCSGPAAIATTWCSVAKNGAADNWTTNCSNAVLHNVTGLVDEDQVIFKVKAVDSFGNAGAPSAPLQWTVDTTPPTVAITLIEPDAPRATVHFTGQQDTRSPVNTRGSPLDYFECKVDGIDGWTRNECQASPKVYDGLAAGQNFTVRFRLFDLAGNMHEASQTWLQRSSYNGPVCRAVARVAIPPAQSGNTNVTPRTFDVSCTSPNGLTRIECSANCTTFTQCLSTNPKPTEFNWVTTAAGPVNLCVRGVDPAGLTGPVDSQSWNYDNLPPTVTITSLQFADGKAEVYFNAADTGGAGVTRTECQLVGYTTWTTCTSPVKYSQGTTAGGSFEAQVRAVDLAGNVTPTTSIAKRTWTNGNWSAWGACSAACGGASGTRTRSCSSPAVLNGGLACSGVSSESCTSGACIPTTNGGWGNWGACSKSCGGLGTQTRTCLYSIEAGYAALCHTGQSETQSCGTTKSCSGTKLCSGCGDPPGNLGPDDCTSGPHAYADPWNACVSGVIILKNPHKAVPKLPHLQCGIFGNPKGHNVEYDEFDVYCQ